MYCEKCGTKNEVDAKFCTTCGNPLEPLKVENEAITKIKKLPKKAKILMSVSLLVVIIAVVVLVVLLNNPVKKVEDGLKSFYDNYEKNNTTELKDIGKVLTDNKKNEDVLKQIDETSNKIITSWVKNFNTEYKDKDELNKTYDKVSNALKDVYNYFKGLEYILDSKTYNEFNSELSKLYTSKINYLYAVNAEDDYSKYSYYLRVIESDSYYKKASSFISEYVKDEIDSFLKESSDMAVFDDKTTNTDKLNAYLKQINFIKENKIRNNVDLSTTEEYKNLYNTTLSNILGSIKSVCTEKDAALDYNGCLDIIDENIGLFDKESNEYKELESLKKTYEDKKPDELVNKYLVGYKNSYASSYGGKINDVEYDNYVYFEFDGENAYRTYRLNNEYKKLITKIVVGPDWRGDLDGVIVIYNGDKELYRSEVITKANEFNPDINIDVTDVDDLKIEFQTTDETSWSENFYLYLVEPYLYK